MKSKSLPIIFLLLIFSTYLVNAQSFCSTPSVSSNLNFNYTFQTRTANNSSYCLKVYFHVIRRSNGIGGQTVENVNEAFNILNQDFNSHNIFFDWDTQIDYIDNDSFFSTPSTAIFNINNHQDGIDIYLFDDSAAAGGRANGVGESSEFWVSGSYWKAPYSSLTKSHVISHEMGHVLFLWHTHHGTYNEGGNDNPCAELVNGTNSSSCGDYVTDTPADPNLIYDVNQNTCLWNSSGTDANGDFYNPDVKLIMSYSDINCLQYFSQEQGERMRNSISTLPHLQQVISSNCTHIEGADKMCTGTPSEYTLTQPINGATINWEYPHDRMYIISGQGTPNCVFGAFNIGIDNEIRATVTYGNTSTVYTKIIDIFPSTTPIKPNIIIAPDNPFNLVCCGQTYTFNHTVCNGNCSNIEWEFNIYYQSPQDFYSFNKYGNTGYITTQKNTLYPLIVGARARNIPENCGNPSEWSSEISRYYGTVSSMSSLSKDISTTNYDEELPLNLYYNNSDKNLHIQFVDLYQWLDFRFGQKNLVKNEIDKIIKLIENESKIGYVKVTIYNIYGAKVFDGMLKEKINTVNLSGLKSGIYFVKYELSNIVNTKTIIKN